MLSLDHIYALLSIAALVALLLTGYACDCWALRESEKYLQPVVLKPVTRLRLQFGNKLGRRVMTLR